MKILVVSLLAILATSCGVNQGVERNYIISEAPTGPQNVPLDESSQEVL